MLSCLARGGRGAALIALVLLCACSPTLDWREVRPEESGAVALFPCKPSNDARMVMLGGIRVRMQLAACQAGGARWALAYADVADPARVTSSLVALRVAAAANLGSSAQPVAPMQVSGMTPNPQAERVRIPGKLPGGEAVTLEAGFFAKGTKVFQASVVGANVSREAMANFFDNLMLPS